MITKERFLIIYIMQIISVYNAILLGWKVKKIGNNKYELSIKNVEAENINLLDFINKLVSCNPIVDY